MEELHLETNESRSPRQTGGQARFIISSAYRVTSSHTYVWEPPTDVYETEEAIVVRVEIAGMSEAEFKISFEGRFLFVQGVRSDTGEPRAYHQVEIRFGEFMSLVEILHPVESDAIQAEYEDGFLRVLLPKAKPQKISVSE